MQSRRIAFTIVLAAAATGSSRAGAQTPRPRADTTKRAAVAGVVRDTAGRPLPLVTVFAEGRDLTTVTDDSGRFHLRVPAGESDFTIMRIGYKAVTFNATLPPDSTVVLQVSMRAVQALPGITVTERVSARLVRDGFYDRLRRGFGHYLTPEQVEKLHYVGTPAQMLRHTPGMRVACGPRERRLTGGCIVTSNFGECVTLFVDGQYVRGQLDERLGTTQVYAIETYSRGALLPMEFIRPVSEQRCGAVVVWTLSRAPR